MRRRAPDLEQIHQEHFDFLWRSLHHLGVRDADLEDALQDVFVVVHRRLGTFDGSSQLTSWLFGICLRVASNQRRRAHRRREELVDAVSDTPDDSSDADPERTAIRAEARETLDTIMDSMTPIQRAVFRMFELEGASCESIAGVIGVPIGTIHSRLHDARKRFERELERRKAQ